MNGFASGFCILPLPQRGHGLMQRCLMNRQVQYWCRDVTGKRMRSANCITFHGGSDLKT
jgi:hypothetical protein